MKNIPFYSFFYNFIWLIFITKILNRYFPNIINDELYRAYLICEFI